MQAVVTAPRAAQTHNLHRAGGRFGVAIVLAPRRALDPTGVLGRTGSLSRAALVVMSLQELAYQLLAPPVQFPFEFAIAHLPGFVGGEEGFGIREDSIGRCARDRAREIANYVVMQAEINIAIGDDPPTAYFGALWRQCENGEPRYGGITDADELRTNLVAHCIPHGMEEAEVCDYDGFLKGRRLLMAGKIRDYYRSL